MLKRFLKPEERYARRMARIVRWDQPIQGGWQRFKAWSNMLLADHGILRLAYLNEHRLGSLIIRAAQPAPRDIRRWAREGVKTIVNLRGGREHGSWQLEKEACEECGIELADFTLRSRGAPDRDAILSLPVFFQSLQTPAVFHCKSGADRAGFMAALYLLVQEKKTAAEAKRQLSLRYGHFRFAKTGILDFFIETYRSEGEARGMDFLQWVSESYKPEALEAQFKPGAVSAIFVDKILRRE